MDEVNPEARATSFDQVARAYDEFRPGYPEELYDRITAFGSLTPAMRVLEVAVGTGKATLPLARRGFAICGLEPGTALSEIAHAHLASFPRVEIQTTTFERWPAERAAFGLALCAQAFHWLDEHLRVAKFAEALYEDGVLAVFGHTPTLADDALRTELDRVYARIAPSISTRRIAESWYASASSPVMAELQASPEFADVEFAAFDWQRTLDAASYCALVSTYSDHATLDGPRRAALLQGIADVIDARGGALRLDYRTGLFLARKTG
jgi:SAM-dependent methyltransferase